MQLSSVLVLALAAISTVHADNIEQTAVSSSTNSRGGSLGRPENIARWHMRHHNYHHHRYPHHGSTSSSSSEDASGSYEANIIRIYGEPDEIVFPAPTPAPTTFVTPAPTYSTPSPTTTSSDGSDDEDSSDDAVDNTGVVKQPDELIFGSNDGVMGIPEDYVIPTPAPTTAVTPAPTAPTPAPTYPQHTPAATVPIEGSGDDDSANDSDDVLSSSSTAADEEVGQIGVATFASKETTGAETTSLVVPIAVVGCLLAVVAIAGVVIMKKRQMERLSSHSVIDEVDYKNEMVTPV